MGILKIYICSLFLQSGVNMATVVAFPEGAWPHLNRSISFLT